MEGHIFDIIEGKTNRVRLYLGTLGIEPEDAVKFFMSPQMSWVAKVEVTRGQIHRAKGRSITITPVGKPGKSVLKKYMHESIDALVQTTQSDLLMPDESDAVDVEAILEVLLDGALSRLRWALRRMGGGR